MSTIFRDADGDPLDPMEREMICHACGGRADAAWYGDRAVAICYRCAVRVLPTLIADAMRTRGRDNRLLVETKDRLLGRFWYAAALALSREPNPEAPIATPDIDEVGY